MWFELLKKFGYPTLMTMIVVMLLVTLASQVRWAILQLSPPFSHTQSVTDTPIVHPGERLRIQYTFTRYRYCNVDINWFVLRDSDGEATLRLRVPGGATLLGKITVTNTIAIPNDFEPNAYTLRTILYSTCPEGAHAAVAEDVKFTVEPKK